MIIRSISRHLTNAPISEIDSRICPDAIMHRGRKGRTETRGYLLACGTRSRLIETALKRGLARRHVIPDVAVNTPPTVVTFEPDHNVFYLGRPGTES